MAEGQCPINKMPIELLTQILEEVTGIEPWGTPRGPDFNDPQLVCKYWWEAYEPVLYRKIILYDPVCGVQNDHDQLGRRHRKREPGQRRNLLQWLQKKFSEHPRFGSYVRALHVMVERGSSRKIWDEMIKVISLCPGISTLEVLGSNPDDLRPVIEAAGRLSRLKTLKVQPEIEALVLQTVLKTFNPCKLNKLTLVTFGMQDDPSPDPHLFRDRSASIKHLDLWNPVGSRNILSRLVAWPSSLEAITFRGLGGGAYQYTMPDLQEMLDVQSASLQLIEIGDYSEKSQDIWGGQTSIRSSRIPDFSQYPNLRALALYKENLFGENPNAAALKLTAPQLVLIRIFMASLDQVGHGLISDFGPTENSWMNDFASNRAYKSLLKNLKTVELDFGSEVYCSTEPEDAENLAWPWAYFEEARKTFDKFGVKLKCMPAPWITGEGWERGERYGNGDDASEDWETEDEDEDGINGFGMTIEDLLLDSDSIDSLDDYRALESSNEDSDEYI